MAWQVYFDQDPAGQPDTAYGTIPGPAHASAPASDPPAAWLDGGIGGSPATWRILGGQVADDGSSGYQTNLLYRPAAEAQAAQRITVDVAAAQTPLLVLRLDAAANKGLGAWWFGGTLRVGRWASGPVDLATAPVPTLPAAVRARLTVTAGATAGTTTATAELLDPADQSVLVSATAADLDDATTGAGAAGVPAVAHFGTVALTRIVLETLAAGPGPATTYTLTAPPIAHGPVGTASGDFTLTPDGTYTGSVTPDDGGAGGTFTPTALVWTGDAAAKTFTYTPGSAGAKTIAATNSGGLADPAGVAYTGDAVTPPAATGYSLTGPSSGTAGAPSGNFTVALTPSGGTVAGTVTVTPHGGTGDAFAPATLGLTTGSPSGTFTVTRAGAGAGDISATNDGGLADPAPVPYTASDPGGGGGTTGLTLTAPVPSQHFRPDPTTGRAAIALAGTYAGDAPAALEFTSDGTTWAPSSSATIGGGTFAATLSLPAGPFAGYTIGVRVAADHAVSATVGHVRVGPRVIAYGQSNMVGQLATAQESLGRLSQYAAPDAGRPHGDWQEYAPSNEPGSGIGEYHSCLPLACEVLREALAAPIGVLTAAVGGQSIAQLSPGGAHYTRLADMVAHAGPGGWDLLVYYQGESDAIAGTARAAYRDALLALADAVHADFGCPTMAATIQRSTGAAYDPTAVNAAIREARAAGGHVLAVGPDFDDLATDGGDALHIHADAVGAIQSARLAVAILTGLYGYGSGSGGGSGPVTVADASVAAIADAVAARLPAPPTIPTPPTVDQIAARLFLGPADRLAVDAQGRTRLAPDGVEAVPVGPGNLRQAVGDIRRAQVGAVAGAAPDGGTVTISDAYGSMTADVDAIGNRSNVVVVPEELP